MLANSKMILCFQNSKSSVFCQYSAVYFFTYTTNVEFAQDFPTNKKLLDCTLTTIQVHKEWEDVWYMNLAHAFYSLGRLTIKSQALK